MNRRKTAVIVLASVLAAGGCARDGGPEGISAAEAGAERPDAAAALDAATNELLKDTFRVTVAFGGAVRLNGVADPRTGAAELVLETGGPAGPGSTVLRMVGGTTYAKIDMEKSGGRPGLDGTKWIRLDKSRSPGGPIDSFVDFDIRRFIGAADSLTDVQWVDDDTVRGLIDGSGARQATGLVGSEPGLAGPASGHSGSEPELAGPASGMSGSEPGLASPASGVSGPESGPAGPASGHSGSESGPAGPASGHSGSEPGPAGPASGLSGSATGGPIGMVPFESDIEPGGRLARFTYTAKVVAAEPEIEFEMVYSDFGLPVQVAVPPAADILTP